MVNGSCIVEGDFGQANIGGNTFQFTAFESFGMATVSHRTFKAAGQCYYLPYVSIQSSYALGGLNTRGDMIRQLEFSHSFSTLSLDFELPIACAVLAELPEYLRSGPAAARLVPFENQLIFQGSFSGPPLTGVIADFRDSLISGEWRHSAFRDRPGGGELPTVTTWIENGQWAPWNAHIDWSGASFTYEVEIT